jgi:CDP-glucose 4,6-dehydratase
MEDLVGLRDRDVLVTGHTGFKGGWLTIRLATLGARVHGYALEPPTKPNLFEVAGVSRLLVSDTRADLADTEELRATLARYRPEVVFHLAAQPLVREGYRDPLGTIATNVLGTANLLEAVRSAGSVRAVVAVATDKVYQNREAGLPFREDDPLGGDDPYSGSKAAAEIVVASFRSSYFGPGRHPARIATARAGNVIGGGDWARDRLVPDCLQAFQAGAAVRLRSPDAVRPWQHVLEPLSGYLRLATRLLEDDGPELARAWNFGPAPDEVETVGAVADQVAAFWGDTARVEREETPAWHEAGVLRLDSSAARSVLGWAPAWSLGEALAATVEWHQAWLAGDDMTSVCRRQIEQHLQAAVA